jgi:hypothetical protein
VASGDGRAVNSYIKPTTTVYKHNGQIGHANTLKQWIIATKTITLEKTNYLRDKTRYWLDIFHATKGIYVEIYYKFLRVFLQLTVFFVPKCVVVSKIQNLNTLNKLCRHCMYRSQYHFYVSQLLL